MAGCCLPYSGVSCCDCSSVAEENTIVGFVDDLNIVVSAQPLENVNVYSTEPVRAVKAELEKVRLTLVNEKIEAVLITDRRKKIIMKVEIGGHTVVSMSAG